MALNACKNLTITLRVPLAYREFPLLFHIKVEDLTWKNLLLTLFGRSDFEDESQLDIQYIRHDKRCTLSDNDKVMSDFVRVALLSPFREEGVTLLIRKYHDYVCMGKPTGNSNQPPALTPNPRGLSTNTFCSTKLKLEDIIKLFGTKSDNIDVLNQNMPYNTKQKRISHLKVTPEQSVSREQGSLHVERLNNEDFTKLLKSGANVVVALENDEFLSMKFNKDLTPSMYEMKLKWSEQNKKAVMCDDLKVPVSMEKNINFVFPQDAEFVKDIDSYATRKPSSTASNASTSFESSEWPRLEFDEEGWPTILESNSSAVGTRQKRYFRTAKGNEYYYIEKPDLPIQPTEARAVPPSTSTVSTQANEPDKFSRDSAPRLNDLYWPNFEPPNDAVDRASKFIKPRCGLSDVAWAEQTRHLITGYRVANGTQPKKPGNPWRAQKTVNKPQSPYVETVNRASPGRAYHFSAPYAGKRATPFDGQEKQPTQSCHIVVSPKKTPAMNGQQRSAQSEQSSNAQEDQMRSMTPPKWLKEELEKFKTQVNEEVSKTMKSLLDAIQQGKADAPSTSGLNKHSKKALPIELAGMETLTLNDKKHRAAEPSRKKKCAGNLRGRIVEVSPDLSLVSTSGYKIRMPRNASFSLKLTLLKYGKYRTSREEPEPRVNSVSDGIECCVTPAGVENSCSWYDVRIKTKDKSGKFRLTFGIVQNGKQVGRSIHFGVRVRKTYTLPIIPDLIDLNSEPSKPNTNVEKAAVAEAPSGSRAFEDEGIGGNQEDFYSPTSDSEDSWDADETQFAKLKNDLPKDEGIDTCYPVAEANKVDWDDSSDSDTNSSISFLMDENEARDKPERESDVINLPSCFIPNADLNEESLSVRVIRKRDLTKSSRKEKSTDESACLITNEEVSSARSTPPASTVQAQPEETTSERLLMNEREAAEHAFYRSIYPNLQGLKEFVNPSPDKPTAAGGATNDDAKPSTSGTKAEPCPVNIIHEKVFETVGNVWNKVYQTKKSFSETDTVNFPKQVRDTMSSVFNTISTEIDNVAKAAGPPSGAAFAAAAKAASEAAAAAQAAVTAATMAQAAAASTTTTAPSDTASTPSASESAANTSHTSVPADVPQAEPVPSSSSSVKSERSECNGSAAHVNSLYENLSEERREKLKIMNEMGFNDDPYCIFLLEQFNDDFNKVIESLINYSSV